MVCDRALAHRARDHPRLAEPAAPGAAAEDLDAVALVHRLGERHQRVARVGPGVEVHQRVLVHPWRHAGTVGRDRDQGAGRLVVGHVVEPRYVDAAARRQPAQHLVAAAGRPLELPLADHLGDGEHDLLAVTEHDRVDVVGDRLGIEGRVTPDYDNWVINTAVFGEQCDAREVERVEHVGIAQLGREGDPEKVEFADPAVAVDGELRDALAAHQRLHVGPHRVGAFGQRLSVLIEDFVENLHALVGQSDLVGVGVHQGPADGLLATPVLGHRVELATDVLDRFRDLGQMRLESGENRLTT